MRPRGEKHVRATLTDDQVRQIIDLLAGGKGRQEIADEFEVGRSVIDGIAKGQNWRHIPRPLGFDVRLPTSKLTEDQVREIRQLRKANQSATDLAKSFGVGPSTIRHIVAGRRWKWLANEDRGLWKKHPPFEVPMHQLAAKAAEQPKPKPKPPPPPRPPRPPAPPPGP